MLWLTVGHVYLLAVFSPLTGLTCIYIYFITLKDHKKICKEKPQVRTLNPAKPELGKVAKKILEPKIEKIRKISGLNSWKNTDAVIKWFSKLGHKKKLRFLVFDVEKFYPSITSELLLKALKWARQYVDISDEEINVVMQARMACMFVSKKVGTHLT